MSRRRLVGTMVNVCTAGIIIGILCMIQPWWFALFKPGFLILLASTIGFIIVTHIPAPASVVTPNADLLEDVPVRATRVD